MLVIIDVIKSCTHALHKWFFVKENLNDIHYLDESDTPKNKKIDKIISFKDLVISWSYFDDIDILTKKKFKINFHS